METITKKLNQLREADPEVALIMDYYWELEKIYKEALEAMGYQNIPLSEVGNSAEFTIVFNPSQTLSNL